MAAKTERLTEGSMERRRSVRFDLNVPVICRYKNKRGRAHAFGGFSRDISERGLFVVGPSVPPEGKAVAVRVLLLHMHKADGHGLQLKSKGLVIRTEPGGFAVSCRFVNTENSRVKSRGSDQIDR